MRRVRSRVGRSYRRLKSGNADFRGSERQNGRIAPCGQTDLFRDNLFSTIALVLAIACGSDAPSGVVTPPVAVASAVHLVSDPGESLGGGATFDYTKANAQLTVRPLGAQLSIRVVGDRIWDGFLSLPGDVRLRTGTFANLSSTPPSGAAGFRWSSQERSCASSVASVTIDSVQYAGDVLRAIDLHFEQRCDGQSAVLAGTVRWRAGDAASPTGPVLPVPPALWRAPPGSTPATGSYVYLDGDASLTPGIPLPRALVPLPGTMSVSAAGSRLAILAFDPTVTLTMSGTFQELIGQTAMQEGYYGNLRSLAESDFGTGGLDVALNASGCASLIGWFVIDHQFYFQGNLTTIDLRFELRCGGFGAPLRGQVHWAE